MLDRSSATVSVTLLLPFLRLLDEQDEPLREAAFDFGERLLARWGVTRAELETDPRKRLPFGLMVEMLTGFVGILGDPSAPLKAGMLLQEGDYELIECLASTCDTL
ncbi:MAG TPA: hypothetical protein VHM19_05920, partial [Polyangiales bacterium]|nr:hypothetical protein [Polyangiales bacterium]